MNTIETWVRTVHASVADTHLRWSVEDERNRCHLGAETWRI